MRRLFLTISVIVIIVAIIHVMLDVVFTYQLRRDIRDIKLKIGILPPPSVAESENAAALYEKALLLMINQKNLSETTQWGYTKPTDLLLKASYDGRNNWTSEKNERTIRLIQSPDIQKFYTLLEKASLMPGCDFHINTNVKNKDENRTISIERLMPGAIYLLLLKARIETYSGNTPKATQTILTALRVLHHLTSNANNLDYPDLFFLQSPFYFLQNILNTRAFFEKEYHALFSTALSFNPDTSFWHLAHMSRFVTGIEKNLQKGVSRANYIRFNPYLDALLPGFYKTHLGKLIDIKDTQMLLNAKSRMLDKYRQPYYKIADELAKIEDLPRDAYSRRSFFGMFWSRWTLQEEKNVLGWIAHEEAVVKLTHVGLALKIYKARQGFYPQLLNELAAETLKEIPVDPFTGKNFVYKKTENGFLIYSLGRNKKDDNGKRNYDSEGKPLEDDIAWKSEN